MEKVNFIENNDFNSYFLSRNPTHAIRSIAKQEHYIIGASLIYIYLLINACCLLHDDNDHVIISSFHTFINYIKYVHESDYDSTFYTLVEILNYF